ncbi:MAG TPA: helicase HerA-like domain-containing protein [Polyangiaceae bacterium]
MANPNLYLGSWQPLDGARGSAKQDAVKSANSGGIARLPAHHLVTHGTIFGMTGSGKTGLLTVMVEEALAAGVPTLMIDIKGDLPNLLLNFPRFDPIDLTSWVEAAALSEEKTTAQVAAEQNELRKSSLGAWNIGEAELRAYHDKTEFRVITPGSSSGELLHVLSSLERRSDRWDSDPEAARDALSAAVSLVLRLLGRDPDPAKSREHVLLAVLAEQRLRRGEPASLAMLLEDLARPPIERIGALNIDAFLPKSERKSLAAALNTLLASPTFATWREGATLDIGAWMKPRHGKTPAVILSVAHLDDEERALVLGVVLEEVLAWVRSLPGSSRLRALLVFDEVYGFLPPHPANPPTKRPIVALMKQARAFGVGVLVATQNPMDVDYRALGNAGVWCIGRLQTDADCARVLDALSATASNGFSTATIGKAIRNLAPRWFVMRDVHARIGTILLQPRWTMSFLRGPMTRNEIRRARELSGHEAPETEEQSGVVANRSAAHNDRRKEQSGGTGTAAPTRDELPP